MNWLKKLFIKTENYIIPNLCYTCNLHCGKYYGLHTYRCDHYKGVKK